jgi:tetratricopeptide (TPR) repeat protein
LTALAIALRKTCEERYNQAILVEAIELHQEALALCAFGDPNRGLSLSGLGAAYHNLHTRSGDPNALTQSIALTREYVALCAGDHPFRYRAVQNLALVLMERYRKHGDTETLEEALALHREGLALCPMGSHIRLNFLRNLGDALSVASRRMNDRDMLSEAISMHREAVSLDPQEPVTRVLAFNGLAQTLRVAFEETASLEFLTEAIRLHRLALECCPSGHIDRSLILNDLASALRCDFEQRNDPTALVEAIALHREALDLRQRGDPDRGRAVFGIALCMLLPLSPHLDYLAGVSHVLDGLTDDYVPVAERLQSGLDVLRVLEKSCATGSDPSCTPSNGELEVRILEAYACIVKLLPRVANLGLNHAARLDALSGCEELSRTAAVRALLLNQCEKAVELLEEGRGVFWCESLRVRRTVMDGLPVEEREDLERALRILEQGIPAEPGHSVARRAVEVEQRRQVFEGLEVIISRIRARPGWGRFLMPRSFDSLLQRLPEGFVVVIISSPIGCHALILNKATELRKSIPLIIPWGGVSSALLHNSLPRGTVMADSEDSRGMRLRVAPSLTLETTLATLWKAVLKPVIEVLGVKVRLTLLRKVIIQLTHTHLRKRPVEIVRVCGSAAPANSQAYCPSTRLASIQDRTANAPPTISWCLAHPRCRP